jgi:O-antigen/teichoic acid export membrane protein
MISRLWGKLLRGEVVSGNQLGFIVIRYGSAILIALEALFFARMLGPQIYGKYAILGQFVVLITLGAIGHPAGYVYAYFRMQNEELDNYYVSGAGTQYILGGLVAAFIAIFIDPHYLVAVALYFLQIPNLLTEPMLRVRNRFAFTAVGRGLASLITLLLAISWLLYASTPGASKMDLQVAVISTLAGNLIGTVLYCYILARTGYLRFSWGKILRSLANRNSWTQYWRTILRPGVPLNASSAILSVFNNIPRLVLDRYYSPVELSVYSLAWQLSQGSMLILSSMNLVSAVEVGQRMSKSSEGFRAALKRQLWATSLVGMGTFVILVCAAFLLTHFVYRDYHDLPLISVLLNSGYLVMNIVGAIMGFLFYERKSWTMNLGYAAATVATLLACLAGASFGVWYGWLIVACSLSLTILNLWYLFLIFRSSARWEQENAGQPVGPGTAR